MGMGSQDFGWQKENMEESKGFYYNNNNLGVPKSPFESIDRIDSSERGILRQVNRNSAGSKERIKSPNSGTNLGSFSYEDRSKHHGFECRCDLGSNCNSTTPRGVKKGSGFKLDPVTNEEMYGLVNNSKFGIGEGEYRPLFHVMSEGNLNELDCCEVEFGSSFEKRFASPKPRIPLFPNTVSDLGEIKRGRCVSESGFGNKETQIQQSPMHFSSYENDPRTDYFSQRRRCVCGTPKCHGLEEEFMGKSLSAKPERKGNIGNKKGYCGGVSKICKGSIVLMLLVILFVAVPMNKSAFFGPNFGPGKLSIGVDQANSFLNPIDLRSNRSEDVNLEGQIEGYDVDLSRNSSEEEEFERQIEEPEIDEGKLEGNTELLVSNGTELVEGDKTMEIPNFTEILIEENSSKDEFKSENLKQCGVSDIIGEELEEGYVALIQTDFGDGIEERKLKMRIRFCVAFVSVLLCASLISCIIRKEQFGSSNKAEKGSKKRARNEESSVPFDGTYGSIVAYEKIAITKRGGGGGTDESLTPVRRSSRIRNYLASSHS